ncbi:MAG: hypothetical protein A2268_11615 [Candidatus Raymondbacteria bacterium RifOxyA12_full_50_37]|uniref:Uncharacterized protein n=1 Tax=Candidatus Raymondbacteria bacterium RIFOXYD12_FULL_49_13 TaxID=1817890 RepID=A0A1F7F3B8_UNCRA|nr:MAG: hypothetical protein A2268_11615 [Candidatus Raymondbacteria bacterium RifOxyA12_full_50_37]OGJ85985.1 MAG: hypothetical protein A2248_00450 [Candidatus Raymondbacteria bacterium RIFOXYA2_FULL_49_16]OGJ90091.1 MAG: hypothetical protein A2350_07990 [Candidatus Raymondbacteria bacterium RifOxyB12_full_50_8]OGJ97133.1 MAG: hypothetical protein A2453_12470 [Candidatus Raymondbacteria bacterium RIFOXYC2_FULL_50_21]OGK01164.1 MAG: hypothetical protein A2519_01425 [Candidatus Raymondbacteria b
MRIFIIAALGLLAASCGERDLALFLPSTYFPDESAVENEKPLANTSAANLFTNLATSYNKRRYDIYRTLISDDYRFYMSDSYWGLFNTTEPPDPAYWTAEDSAGKITGYYLTRDQELETIRNMLDPAKKAKDIELSFQKTALDTTRTDTSLYLLTNIEFKVTMRLDQEINMARGEAELMLVRGTGNLWKISIWRDKTLGSDNE